MKSLACSYVWWPDIDADLESQVKQCNQCQLNRPSLPAVLMHPWEWPDHPWDRVHVDYPGPFMGQMFLIVIDAYSKWMEIEIVKFATAQNTIERCLPDLDCLKRWFQIMELASLVVTFLTLPQEMESSIYVLPPITPLPTVRQRGLCRPLS